LIYVVWLCSRNIVNAISTFCDQIIDFGNAGLASIIDLFGTARPKAASMDRKNERVKYSGVSIVERAIDEHIINRRPYLNGQPRFPLSISTSFTAVLAARIETDPALEAGFNTNIPVAALRPRTEERGVDCLEEDFRFIWCL
jgi:hypothetical protein